jgi:hypothetical protein
MFFMLFLQSLLYPIFGHPMLMLHLIELPALPPETRIITSETRTTLHSDLSKLINNPGIFNDIFHLMLRIYILQPFTDNGIKLDRIFEVDPMGTFQRL